LLCLYGDAHGDDDGTGVVGFTALGIAMARTLPVMNGE